MWRDGENRERRQEGKYVAGASVGGFEVPAREVVVFKVQVAVVVDAMVDCPELEFNERLGA